MSRLCFENLIQVELSLETGAFVYKQVKHVSGNFISVNLFIL